MAITFVGAHGQTNLTGPSSFEVPEGEDRVLVGYMGLRAPVADPPGILYGGAPLTLVAEITNGSLGSDGSSQSVIFIMVAPPVGSALVEPVHSDASQRPSYGVALFTGVDQANPVRDFGTAAVGSPTAISVAVDSLVGDMVVGGAHIANTTDVYADEPQIEAWRVGRAGSYGTMSYVAASAGSTTLGHTADNGSNKSTAALSLIPAGGAAPATRRRPLIWVPY